MRSGNGFAERGERGGGVARGLRTRRSASLPDSHRRAEDVVEVGHALRGHDGVAPADVRLVDEALIATLDEREAVPEEVLRSGGRRRFRRNRHTVITRPVAIIGAGKLTVDVVVVGVGPFALGDREDLVEIAVAVGPVALLDETPRRVVGVASSRRRSSTRRAGSRRRR